MFDGSEEQTVSIVVTGISNPTLIRIEKGQGGVFFYYLYRRVSDIMMEVPTTCK